MAELSAEGQNTRPAEPLSGLGITDDKKRLNRKTTKKGVLRVKQGLSKSIPRRSLYQRLR